eukprot:3308067-Pleurochrysis_carterae.AAC.1
MCPVRETQKQNLHLAHLMHAYMSYGAPTHGKFLPKSVSVRSPVCEPTLGASFLFPDMHSYAAEGVDVFVCPVDSVALVAAAAVAVAVARCAAASLSLG